MQDELVEPVRARFVPVYDAIRSAAMEAGASPGPDGALVAPAGLRRHGCLVVMGSEGRGEYLMKTDQDNGMILADGLALADNGLVLRRSLGDLKRDIGPAWLAPRLGRAGFMLVRADMVAVSGQNVMLLCLLAWPFMALAGLPLRAHRDAPA